MHLSTQQLFKKFYTWFLRSTTGTHQRIRNHRTGVLFSLAILPVLGMSPAQAGTFIDVFAKNAQGSGYSTRATASTTDAFGNTYVTGNFSKLGGSMVMGGFTLSAIGPQDAFVAKFDPAGAVLWARNYGGTTASIFGKTIGLDSSGNVVVGGDFSGGNVTMPYMLKIGNSDAFLMKMDANGNMIWARNYGGSLANASILQLAEDSAGNTVAVGQFNKANLTNPSLAMFNGALAGYNSFAIKVDVSGYTLWAQRFGGATTAAVANGVAIDSAQNIVIAGGYWGGVMTTPALPSPAGTNCYVIKLNSVGGLVWAKNFGSYSGGMQCISVATDAAGNIGVGGNYGGSPTNPVLPQFGSSENNTFGLKLNSVGTLLFASGFGGAESLGQNAGVALDANGNMLLSGWSQGPMTSPALSPVSASYIYSVLLGPTGAIRWTWNLGSGDASYGVSANSANTFAADGSRNMTYAGFLYNYNYSVSNPVIARVAIPL